MKACRSHLSALAMVLAAVVGTRAEEGFGYKFAFLSTC